ncbi:MAG TPA: GNAT family N-acetyltransferase [Actinomycetota bacterium]|nr:GNAT family N-acetyltransferase [Actinomycetota bacterium]
MDIKAHSIAESFDLDVWRELLEADPNRHIFSTPEWNRLWWERFGEGKQEGLVLTFSDSETVALAALTIDRTDEGRRVRFLGGDDLTDYQGPLIASEKYRRAVAEAFLNYLVTDFDDWDYLEAKGLPVPFHFSEWLVEAADRLKLDFELELHELTAVLMLPGRWEEYLAGLGKKKRHELERKMRRFDREAPGAVLRSSDEATLAEDIEAFIQLHKTSAGEKGEFMLPAREAFFREIAHTLQPLGMLALDFLELDGRPIAATISFRYDGVFYLYNSAYDLSLRPISPGLILVARLIERSISEKARRFDFLRGRERYKYDLGAEALPLHWISIRHPAGRESESGRSR